MTWITQSMSVGGEMTVKRFGFKFLARMEWPNNPRPIMSVGETPKEAIDNLEQMLRDDCAQEMIDKGVV
jgi:hypothetical protein